MNVGKALVVNSKTGADVDVATLFSSTSLDSTSFALGSILGSVLPLTLLKLILSRFFRVVTSSVGFCFLRGNCPRLLNLTPVVVTVSCLSFSCFLVSSLSVSSLLVSSLSVSCSLLGNCPLILNLTGLLTSSVTGSFDVLGTVEIVS